MGEDITPAVALDWLCNKGVYDAALNEDQLLQCYSILHAVTNLPLDKERKCYRQLLVFEVHCAINKTEFRKILGEEYEFHIRLWDE